MVSFRFAIAKTTSSRRCVWSNKVRGLGRNYCKEDVGQTLLVERVDGQTRNKSPTGVYKDPSKTKPFIKRTTRFGVLSGRIVFLLLPYSSAFKPSIYLSIYHAHQ